MNPSSHPDEIGNPTEGSLSQLVGQLVFAVADIPPSVLIRRLEIVTRIELEPKKVQNEALDAITRLGMLGWLGDLESISALSTIVTIGTKQLNSLRQSKPPDEFIKHMDVIRPADNEENQHNLNRLLGKLQEKSFEELAASGLVTSRGHFPFSPLIRGVLNDLPLDGYYSAFGSEQPAQDHKSALESFIESVCYQTFAWIGWVNLSKLAMVSSEWPFTVGSMDSRPDETVLAFLRYIQLGKASPIRVERKGFKVGQQSWIATKVMEELDRQRVLTQYSDSESVEGGILPGTSHGWRAAAAVLPAFKAESDVIDLWVRAGMKYLYDECSGRWTELEKWSAIKRRFSSDKYSGQEGAVRAVLRDGLRAMCKRRFGHVPPLKRRKESRKRK
ncbi:hypothetical protein WKV53_22265 [Luteolibacter sp. Y139]|uniref:Uncharacterized protein n=2 Tax=Luteolibacter soli TaxID=3135280 RepID=A0ABU9B0Q8_9BACT